MPEGPSLVIAKELMFPFQGKIVRAVSGNSKIDKDRLLNKKLVAIKTWGKHLLFVFPSFSLRFHFLMFGSYTINEEKKGKIPRLSLRFAKGAIHFYACAIRVIEEDLDALYDWSADVMNVTWNARQARKKLKSFPHILVTDALLDQNIFSGVGNIIKNEVLYRIRVHPKTRIGDLPSRKLTDLIREARNYSFDFLEWKKQYVLKKHWQVHTKKICLRDGNKILKEYIGTTNRRTFYCEHCQVLYGQ